MNNKYLLILSTTALTYFFHKIKTIQWWQQQNSKTYKGDQLTIDNLETNCHSDWPINTHFKFQESPGDKTAATTWKKNHLFKWSVLALLEENYIMKAVSFHMPWSRQFMKECRVKWHLKRSSKQSSWLHSKIGLLSCVCQHSAYACLIQEALQATSWCFSHDWCSAMPQLKDQMKTILLSVSFRHKTTVTVIQWTTDTTHKWLQSPAKLRIMNKQNRGKSKLTTLKTKMFPSRKSHEQTARKIMPAVRIPLNFKSFFLSE